MSNWKDKFPKENRYFETENGILYCNNVINQIQRLPNNSIDCVITSPPYWKVRDYNTELQIGMEVDFNDYLKKLWFIFDKIYLILKQTGTIWINIGDLYNNKRQSNYPINSLLMIPERFAIGMIDQGWILRNQIIWHKPNAMPENVTNRFTRDFEKIFFFVKHKKYFFNQIKEKARRRGKRNRKTIAHNEYAINHVIVVKEYKNKRTVWSIATKGFKGSHFATFPIELPLLCIEAGCPINSIVLDPFMGSGTTAIASEQLGRRWIGIELNPDYCEITKQRIIDFKNNQKRGEIENGNTKKA